MLITGASQGLGRQLAIDFAREGAMDTAMHCAASPDEDRSEWADPADVTEIFIHLASDESREVNGQRFRAQEEEPEEAAARVS